MKTHTLMTCEGIENNGGGVLSEELQLQVSNLPKNGAEWVETLVNEMTNSFDINDAKARASLVLEVLGKSIRTQAAADVADNLHQENARLKEKMELLIRENSILKRAVAIQYKRQKEADKKTSELQLLKQLVAQYQERLRILEVNNYALTVHLKQAHQQSNSMSSCYPPDVC
ncbi:hypothetical protein AQUCO_03700284v1 [Aquilegia coerulea]|uniref:BZIP domain-containing protein n=1 Tax=Aquilegia coerulea TaxID=218851 RepID=A0A2G5CVI8_AQUCA|nr:hypothetical protein AQUCO_03700284v1 [Aquilegia coerulea]